MRRADAIARVVATLADEVIVTANGWIGRETFATADRPEHFYMLGSMGLAAPIALGIALARPERRVVVFDGDGNLLMTLGTLAMIAEQRPRNLLHVVFDNEVYGSTGGQRSASRHVPLDALALAAGYADVQRASTEGELDAALRGVGTGPAFLLVKVAAEADGQAPRVPYEPAEIARRVRDSLTAAVEVR
jgi:phosphonopyruvate decarboxylase/sulfopyruvate decarboxylase subunit beta